jgi:hypothetical protein
MQLPDAARRAIRTFVQAFTGVIVVQAAAIAVNAQQGEYVLDVDWLKRVGISALAAGVIALVTWVHNWAEDNTNLPAVLKATPSSGQNPATVDPPK